MGRRESLALRRGSATQVTKVKRDIQLYQGNCLSTQRCFQRLSWPASQKHAGKRSKFCSLFLPLSLQGPSLSLLSMWLPCSNHYGSQDAMNVTLESGILMWTLSLSAVMCQGNRAKWQHKVQVNFQESMNIHQQLPRRSIFLMLSLAGKFRTHPLG